MSLGIAAMFKTAASWADAGRITGRPATANAAPEAAVFARNARRDDFDMDTLLGTKNERYATNVAIEVRGSRTLASPGRRRPFEIRLRRDGSRRCRWPNPCGCPAEPSRRPTDRAGPPGARRR